ncbi:MAG: methylmalonyl-CoA mutase family protein, partial [Hymenobacteraceae bacterium]|nr:methylmalonyl-CoA mutase family protein [Hymenobacteraceae bacterium]
LPQTNAAFLKNFYKSLSEKKISHHGLKGFIEFEPIVTGKTDLKQLEDVLEITKNDADFYGITISGAHFANRGATVVQEIAFTLSVAVSKIHKLTEAGNPLETVLRNMQFHLASGTNYFFEIAKLRAIRLLWSTIVQAYEAEQNLAALLRIHCSTSRWYQTTFDPYVNLLRATTEAMAAVIGGCDSVSVAPFDSTYKEASEFSERISRNIPIILKEEAYLNKAVDPAAGSYYLETLTMQLAEAAWNLFQEIEKAGGYTEAAQAGIISEQVNKISKQKFKDIASGKEVLVGTNKYPNPNEKTEFDPAKLIRSQSLDSTRASYPYEVMRMATLNHYLKRNQRPQAIIVSIGEAIQRHINTSFAREFFSCAGFDTQLQVFDNIAEAARILEKQQPAVLVFSTSEAEFDKFANVFNPDIKQKAGKTALILAADPQNMKENLMQQGFDDFLFKGCDTETIISRIQQKLEEE